MDMSMKGINMPSSVRFNPDWEILRFTSCTGLFLIESRISLYTGESAFQTGSTTITGTTMLGDNQRLQYMMQTGTGTWDVMPSVTYNGGINKLAWEWKAERL